MVFNYSTNQLFHENAQKKKAVGQLDQSLSLNNESKWMVFDCGNDQDQLFLENALLHQSYIRML